MTNKIYLVSFGDNDYYIKLAKYLVKKISHKHLDCIPLVYSKSDLPQSIIEFCEQYKKGYGYFIWKPYIIEKTFTLMTENDILLYIDGRTYYTGKKISQIEQLILNKNLDAVFWQMDGLYEYQYTKGEFLNLFKDNHINKKSAQIAATFFLLEKI